MAHATGSYHFGLTVVPFAFLVAAAIGLLLRRQCHARHLQIATPLAATT